MANSKSYYVDDFLEGSYISYAKNIAFKEPYLFYPRIFGRQKLGPNYYNEMEYWQEYTISYTVRGKGELVTKGRTYTVNKGDLIFINDNLYHSLKTLPNEEWEICFIHIYQNPAISSIYQEFSEKFGPLIHDYNEDYFLPYIDKIGEEHNKNSKDSQYAISELIYQLLMKLVSFTASKTATSSNPIVMNILLDINENYTQNIKAEEIAKKYSYSKTHIERLFKKEMGHSLKSYILSLRLSLAKELITTTNLSFDEIALRVGFNEYRSLYYLFKKYINMTPNEYKAKSVIKHKKRGEKQHETL
ncbi:MAG: AraC family transcriptional regulator [Bacilli bacterium]|nr:AraC family transcriptional regulator [Bacilli bacterium]